MSKQDRQGARTITDLERKYNIRKNFNKFMGAAEDAMDSAENARGAAEDARKVAEKAKETADKLTESFEGLDQDIIFNLLTNNGEQKGIYRHNRQLYINASYLATGIIKSANGKLSIDLSGETEAVFNTGISANGLVIEADEDGVSDGIVLINVNGNNAALVVDEDNLTHLTIDKINGKTVSWKDNEDGTFTLIGQ